MTASRTFIKRWAVCVFSLFFGSRLPVSCLEPGASTRGARVPTRTLGPVLWGAVNAPSPDMSGHWDGAGEGWVERAVHQGLFQGGKPPAHRDTMKEISTRLHTPLSSNRCFPKLNLQAVGRPGRPLPWGPGDRGGQAGSTGGGLSERTGRPEWADGGRPARWVPLVRPCRREVVLHEQVPARLPGCSIHTGLLREWVSPLRPFCQGCRAARSRTSQPRVPGPARWRQEDTASRGRCLEARR